MKSICFLLAILLSSGANALADPDPNFHIYLCFGQSNMESGGRMNEADRNVDDRFLVMADFDNADRGWEKDHWYRAVPPLAARGRGMCMVDSFGRTLVAGLPDNCPECREELTLAIRTRGLRLGWFLLAIAPCAYCGIIAPILLADIIYETRVLDRIVIWPWWAAAGVGFVSGAWAIMMLRQRERFLRRTVASQKSRAFANCIVHALLFLGLLAVVWR
jgi:hypothetical protein